MRAVAWLVGVCLVLAGMVVGLVSVVGYFGSPADARPETKWVAIGLGVCAFLVVGYGISLTQWAKRAGETTLRGFNRLPIGATADECITALGTHGRQMTSSTESVNGKVVERQQCFWTNKDDSYCEIILENGHVVWKSQVGLN